MNYYDEFFCAKNLDTFYNFLKKFNITSINFSHGYNGGILFVVIDFNLQKGVPDKPLYYIKPTKKIEIKMDEFKHKTKGGIAFFKLLEERVYTELTPYLI